MRLETLLLRGGQGEHRLHFHERMTVLAGLTPAARQYLIEELVGTLAGLATDAGELTYVDRHGRRTTLRRVEGGVVAQHPDGAAAAHPTALLELDAFGLFKLAYLQGSDIGVASRHAEEPKELREARAALAAVTDELGAGEMARDTARALAVELKALEAELHDVDHGREKRRFARLCMKLEHAKREAAALAATDAELATDRTTIATLNRLRPLVAEWREARKKVEAESARFGDRPRLHPETLAGALTLPELPPPNLDDLTTAFEVAQGERDALASKLAAILTTRLPAPDHPEVIRLAHHDQESLWQTARWAHESGLKVEREALALGGIVPDGVRVKIVDELDEAHAKVEQARETIEERKFGALAAAGSAALAAVALPVAPIVAPIALAGAASAAYWAVLAPRMELAEAEGWEEQALTRAGVPTYLAFHLRRQHALADPSARRPLEEAAEEHRRAIAAWRALAGELDPGDALGFESEVRHYAAQLESLASTGEELDELRRRLDQEAEPAVERAREALLAACRPYGIEDTTLAADLVRQLAQVAVVARAQHALELAEEAEKPLAAQLDRLLTDAGWPEGPLANRVASLDERAAAAEERLRQRAAARPVEVVRNEVEELEALVQEHYRPEFGAVRLPDDAREPDVEGIRSRLAATKAAYITASRLVPDVARLSDRKSAMERRVASLVAELGETRFLPVDIDLVEAHLRRRIERASAVGPSEERVPLLLDDPFATTRADQKWELLDLVSRIAASGQVLLFTEDPDVRRWAAARSQSGAVMLLEPAAAVPA